MALNDFHNRILSVDNIMINMGKTHLIYMSGKIYSHLLFEKAAEIFSVQAKVSRNLLKGNWLCIVFCNVYNDFLKAILIFG